MKELPLITVVTVVYNGADVIKDTIKSVMEQDYPILEYIIIDGSSTDETLDIIKECKEVYKDRITYHSEKDSGVYDAMNKAIALATGEWILFMNAGDYFYAKESISNVLKFHDTFDDYSVIYGDAEFRLKNIAYISEASDKVDTNQYMPFSHQAAFTRTSVAKNTLFDLDFKIAADTAFFLRLTIEGHKMKHVPVIICSYNALEGLSASNEVKRSKEIVNLQAKLNGIDPNSDHFTNYIKDAKKKERIKKILPSFVWIWLRERNAKKQHEKVYFIDSVNV